MFGMENKTLMLKQSIVNMFIDKYTDLYGIVKLIYFCVILIFQLRPVIISSALKFYISN